MKRKPLPMTRLQALKKGIELPPVPRFSHYDWIQDAPDAALQDVLTQYGKLNLKDQRDPENRWCEGVTRIFSRKPIFLI